MSTNFEIDHEAANLFGMAMAYGEEIADAESIPLEEMDEGYDDRKIIKEIRNISLKSQNGPTGNAFVNWSNDVNAGKVKVTDKAKVLNLRTDNVF